MNTVEIFNEICILLVSYHVFLFTDIIIDVNIRNLVGLLLIGVTIFNITANMLVVMYYIIKIIKKTFLKYKNAFKIVKNRS